MYRAITVYGHTFQSVPLLPRQSAGPRSLVATEGVSIDFLSSRYLDISVPWVRLATLYIQVTIPPKRWVSPFGHPRIKACLSAPRGFSQTSTSFIAFCRQGIHHARLVTWSYNPKLFLRYCPELFVVALTRNSHVLTYAPAVSFALRLDFEKISLKAHSEQTEIMLYKHESHLIRSSWLTIAGAAKLQRTNTNKFDTPVRIFFLLTQSCVYFGEIRRVVITITPLKTSVNPRRS